MRWERLTLCVAASCLGTLVIQAQETNSLELLQQQLKQLQQDFERTLQQQRQQIEALQRQLEALQALSAAGTTSTPALPPKTPTGPAPAAVAPPALPVEETWTPTRPIPVVRSGPAYMNSSWTSPPSHAANVFQSAGVLRFYLDGIQFALGDLEANAHPR
jgi:TolA-binding protein